MVGDILTCCNSPPTMLSPSSELSCAPFPQRGLVQNLSYENEFYLHVNEKSFSYERPCTKTHSEREVQATPKRPITLNSSFYCKKLFIFKN